MKTDIPERQLLIFEALFADVLNADHELLRAARLIGWDGLDEALSVYYSPIGRHGKSIRLMVGIHILKRRYNCSDDRAVEMLHENAYLAELLWFQQFSTRSNIGFHHPGEVQEPNRDRRDAADRSHPASGLVRHGFSQDQAGGGGYDITAEEHCLSHRR